MAVKLMALRRDDRCSGCGAALPAGTTAQWDSTARVVTCLTCAGTGTTSAPAPTPAPAPAPAPADPEEAPPIDHGQPGASARAEYERRHAKHEAQIEEKWGTGRLGKVAKFLSDDPQTTTAWAAGAAGEERVAQVLHEGLGDQAVVLHDRKVPGTRGNIDHLVIAASGVWIVDPKKYQGKVEQRDMGGWFKTDLRLYVGGRDRTKIVKGLDWQVAAVTAALQPEQVPVQTVLCFVGSEWPYFAKPFRLDEVVICWPKVLAGLIAVDGPLTDIDIERVARHLSVKLPAK